MSSGKVGMNAEELKRTISMPELVRQYGMKISRAGFIRCPFHTEKTASCKIYADSFHCFGCGAQGDIFSFMQRMDGISFRDACRKLGGEEVRLTDADKAKISRRRNEANGRAERKAKLEREFSQVCHDLRMDEYIREHCEVGGPAWCEAVNEIPKLEGRADDLLEKLWER